MAEGLSTTAADAALTAIIAYAAFVQLHTADPGSAGTIGVSSVTTREAVSWATPSAGSVSANGTLPSWTSWAGTSPETDTDVSFWSLVTAGVFGMSMLLSSSVIMNTGDSLTLTAITVTIPTAS